MFRHAGWVSPIVAVNGMAVGVWDYDLSGGWLVVTVEPFTHIDTARRQRIDHEVDLLGAYFGASATVTYKQPP